MNRLLLIIHFSLGSISWILYGLVSKYINSHRKQFNSAFLKLWKTFAFINIIQYLTVKLYYQIPLHISSNSTFSHYLINFPYQEPLTLLYFLNYYISYCQRICIVLIISISFRVIVFPFSSSPIWERQHWIAAIFIFCTPIPFIYNVLFTKPRYNYIPMNDGFVLYPPVEKHQHKAAEILIHANIFEISTAVLCIALKISSFLSLSRNSVRKRNDRNLYLITTILFLTSTLKFICAVLLISNTPLRIKQIVIYLYPMTADCVALSCPYSILYINKTMRKSIFNCTWITKNKESTNGTSV